MLNVPSIDPITLKAELDGPNPPIVIDVREPEELEYSFLPDAVEIPLHDLPLRLGELDPSSNFVVICRVGGRSAQATDYLLQHGFRQVRNLTGGMNAWARQVDPSMAEY